MKSVSKTPGKITPGKIGNSAKLKNFSKTQNPTQKSGAGVQDFSCKRVESKVRPVHDRHVSKISWDPAMGREGPDHKKA